MNWLMMFCAAACAACVSPPDENPITVSVMPRADSPRADGHGRADVEILLDEAARLFRHDVTVRVSGAWLGEGTEFVAATPEDGRLIIPIRYGRVPGPVQITVRAGPQIAIDDSLMLNVQRPDVLIPHPPSGALDSATSQEFSLRVDLLAEADGARVSEGTRIWFAACCAGPSACDEPPITVDPLAVMDAQTDQVTAQIRARSLPMADMPGTVEGVVVAGLDGPPACNAGVLNVPVAVALPFDPFAQPD